MQAENVCKVATPPHYTHVEFKSRKIREKLKHTFFLIEGDSLMRYGIEGWLRENSSSRCLGSSGNVLDFFDFMEEAKNSGEKDSFPEILVTDVNLEGDCYSGISLIRHCHKLYPEIKIIVYSENTSPSFLNATIEAGAMGYVAKQSDGRELKNAIDSVLRGMLYVDSQLAKKLVSFEHFISRFTKREAEILCLIMQKYSNTEIAEKLCLTRRTVENNISRIYVKTGLSTREELVRYGTSF